MLRFLILLLALGAGGGAAWIATQETAPELVAEASAPAATEMTAVLMAARDVARASQVTADALVWQQWPADAVPAAFIERSARPNAAREITGQFASREISSGEPIVDTAFTQSPGGFLAALLTPGKRAVAIHASTQSTAGGFILPNDRVDVLHTSQGSHARSSGEVRSRTILRDVRILAIDQTTNDTGSGTVLGKTATLELTEAQAEAVTAAEATGTLSLSLRPMNEVPGEASMEIETPPRTIRIHRGTLIEDVVID